MVLGFGSKKKLVASTGTEVEEWMDCRGAEFKWRKCWRPVDLDSVRAWYIFAFREDDDHM